MRSLPSGPQFCTHIFVVIFLRIHEALQVEGIVRSWVI